MFFGQELYIYFVTIGCEPTIHLNNNGILNTEVFGILSSVYLLCRISDFKTGPDKLRVST